MARRYPPRYVLWYRDDKACPATANNQQLCQHPSIGTPFLPARSLGPPSSSGKDSKTTKQAPRFHQHPISTIQTANASPHGNLTTTSTSHSPSYTFPHPARPRRNQRPPSLPLLPPLPLRPLLLALPISPRPRIRLTVAVSMAPGVLVVIALFFVAFVVVVVGASGGARVLSKAVLLRAVLLLELVQGMEKIWWKRRAKPRRALVMMMIMMGGWWWWRS